MNRDFVLQGAYESIDKSRERILNFLGKARKHRDRYTSASLIQQHEADSKHGRVYVQVCVAINGSFIIKDSDRAMLRVTIPSEADISEKIEKTLRNTE